MTALASSCQLQVTPTGSVINVFGSSNTTKVVVARFDMYGLIGIGYIYIYIIVMK